MQQPPSEDFRLMVDLKAQHFRGKVWTAWSNADSSAYENTNTLPHIERSTAILKAWRNYVECDLVPLVREAVPHAVHLAKLAKSTFAEREKFALDLVTQWISEPARKHTKLWFITACDGPAHRFTVDQLSRRAQSDWRPPNWFDAGHRCADPASLVSDKQQELALRLEHVCADAIAAIAERLMPDEPSLLYRKAPASPEHRIQQPKAANNAKRPQKPDPRKAAIAEIIREHPTWKALQICREMDRRAERNLRLRHPWNDCPQLWTDARNHGDRFRVRVDQFIGRIRKLVE